MVTQGAVIFDFDGVLADSIGLYYTLYREVARRFNRPFGPQSQDEFRDWYNPKWEENYRLLGLNGFQREQAMQWVGEHTTYDEVHLFPNVKDMIMRLHQSYPLAVASTTSHVKIREVLKREGLLSHFRVVLGGGDDGSDKAKMVGEAWRTLGAPAASTVMVGDTSMDVSSARTWGLPAVAVTYGWMSRARLEPFHPTVMVDHCDRLEPTITDILQRK